MRSGPKYNKHGQTLGYYRPRPGEVFPEWQFVLYDDDDDDDDDETVLAEGHTVPVAWDGTDTGLGPGIDATITGAFDLQAAGGRPTAVSALAAEIPRRHQRRGLARVMLQAMAGLARDAGLSPVHIDRDDAGEYWEPNIWIIHQVGGRTAH